MSTYNEPIVKVISATDIQEERRKEREQRAIEKFMDVAVVAAGLAATPYAFKKLNISPDKLTFLNQSVNPEGDKVNSWFDIKSKNYVTAGDAALEVTRRFEELTPLKIGRTFQLSHVLMPVLKYGDAQMSWDFKTIQSNKEHFLSILGDRYDPEKIKDGLRLINGSLVYSDGSVALKHASMVATDFITGKNAFRDGNKVPTYRNNILQHYRNIKGVDPSIGYGNLMTKGQDPFLPIGAQSKGSFYMDWMRAHGRSIFYKGAEVLDKPFSWAMEYFPAQNSKFTRSLKNLLTLNMGPGGDYSKSVPRAIGAMAKNMGPKMFMIASAYTLADYTVRSMAGEDNAFSKGILAGASTLGVKAHLTYAETYSDNLQWYKEAQEEIAPGSTDLATLAGMPLEGMLLGGMAAYGKRLLDTNRYGLRTAEEMAAKELPILGSKFASASKIPIIGKRIFRHASRTGRWATRGGLLGLALVAPFVPGATIGETSEELRDIYTGEKDVAIRKNRWWFSGSTPYEGDSIKYFDKHWYAKLMAETETASVYGDQETKDALNPLLNPFDYLKDPYKLEKMHAEDRPYPIWGMDVSWGSFLGKAYERTIGQIIKPDIINPLIEEEKKKYQEYVDTRVNTYGSFNGFNIASGIDEFKKENMSTREGRAEIASRIADRQKLAEQYHGKLKEEDIVASTPDRATGIRQSRMASIDLSKYRMEMDDADTVFLYNKEDDSAKPIEIRLSGLDAPEVGGHDFDPLDFLRYEQEQPFGREGTEILKDIVSKQSNLNLYIDRDDMSYGRYVGVLVGDDNTNINMEVIKQGGATALPWGRNDLMSRGDLMAAEEQAIQGRAGLWGMARYEAFKLFSDVTGFRQTNNTLARLDKLSERPELAAYVSYLEDLDNDRRALTEKEREDITQLANSYLESSGKYRAVASRLENLGMQIDQEQDGFKQEIERGPTALDSDGITGRYPMYSYISKSEQELIEEGKLLAPETPIYDPVGESLRYSREAMFDFLGLQGWMMSLAAEDLELSKPELHIAKSGEITKAATRFSELNLGGAMSLTEPQRRFLPTSSNIKDERRNPLSNTMPSWLPGDNSDYYINFRRGDPYRKIEHGSSRLPGRGYETLYPELEGLDPEDYPDIHKYKILSNVAAGSPEYYRYKNIMEKRYSAGTLTNHELGVFHEVKRQELEKIKDRKFREYKSEEEYDAMTPFGAAVSKYWETLTHNAEVPLENLTFFRPAGKLVHSRTAIEDYQKSQLWGSDMAIWTKPYEQFIKPTIDESIGLFNDTYVPQDVQDKRNVNEFFDKLEYLKYRRLYIQSLQEGEGREANQYKNAYQKTMLGAYTSGLDSQSEILRAYISLPKEQRAYFSSFVQANKEDRQQILEMVPENQAILYQSLWSRKDATEEVVMSGGTPEDVEAEVQKVQERENQSLRNEYAKEYKQYLDTVGDKGATTFREYLADQEAAEYISNSSEVPTKDFIGWDPRIDMDKVKLRTLSIGEEDFHKYGFWKQEEEDLKRYKAVMDDQEVVNKIDEIKKKIHTKHNLENRIMDMLSDKGYNVKEVTISPGNNQIEFDMQYED